MMKKILVILILVLGSTFTFAQQHLSVPLSDPVYQILDNALIKNYVSHLSGKKPYSVSIVLDALNEIKDNPRLSPQEKILILDTITRFEPKTESVWYKDGKYRYSNAEKEDRKFLNNIEVGGMFDISAGVNFNELALSTEIWLLLYLRGDLSDYFSYNINGSLGVTKTDLKTYSPHTFTQSWDGYRYTLKGFNFIGLGSDAAFAAQFKPEFSLSLWDNKFGLNFSRTRRDWGFADGNLMLSETARPFMAVDFHLNPVNWFNLSFITGTTEFRRDNDIKQDAWAFQNNYSAASFDFYIGKWVHLGITSSAVWAKRAEFGYLNPGMFMFFYQNMIGDFDNMQIGLNLGVNIPKYARLYFSFFLNEISFEVEDFLHAPRNIFALQAGAKIALPNIPFSTLILQYTKLEPYMYTHAPTDVPWYSHPVNTKYLNHGESIGYYLPPNSDEIKIKFESAPFWFLTSSVSYKMIRHGVSAAGSTYEEEWEYSTMPRKDFLKDGVYEWIHSLTFNAEYNMKAVDLPFYVGAEYTFGYKHLTEYDGGLKSINSYVHNGSSYKSGFFNLFSVYVKIYHD
ncbi:MAG: hypothetical protein ACRC4W_07685 [Treponemataceae bacterium]